jgi:hypothetical protein
MNITKVGLRILMAIMILAGGVVTGRAGEQARPEAGTTERVSVASGGTEGNAESSYSDISADGRYVVFESYASNLVDGDNNNFCTVDDDGENDDNCPDIFVHDRLSGETTRVSIASDSAQSNHFSTFPSISADGRYVAFTSTASNLVPNDTNGFDDVFVHDRDTGETIRVSVSSGGIQGDSLSYMPAISADGQHVAFASFATNLVGGDTNGNIDIFVHDLASGETLRVSVASDGTQANDYSYRPSISGDGQRVAFGSWATNLIAGDTNGWPDIFVHDSSNGETQRVSVASDGTQTNEYTEHGEISDDGGSVAFFSYADNLVGGDTNGCRDIFAHDILSGETTLVSRASDGTLGDSDSTSPSISGDGRFVAFQSFSENLVPGDTNDKYDIFLHDRLSGVTSRVSISNDGTQSDDNSWEPAISYDGQSVAFDSYAANLVEGDIAWCDYDGDGVPDGNCKDVFVHETGEVPGELSISGHVTDELGDPVSGVQVSTDTGVVSVTEADGYFTISGLITGTYTITPSKPDFIFNPASNVVSVPPDATGIDFMASWQPGPTERVSVSSEETQGNNYSSLAFTSFDGRFVAFSSFSNNLVEGDTNISDDIFVRDRETGETTRVSIASDGSQADYWSYYSSLSADGSMVAFDSYATNLVPGDTNMEDDIFVHNRDTGETSMVSVASDGTQGNRSSVVPSISADGRYVAFESDAFNLVLGDNNARRDIFVHDRDTGETTRVSVSSNGTEANGWSYYAEISADGRYVAFESDASNLVEGDNNARSDVFVHDRQTGETTRVSVASDGTEGNEGSNRASLSADGHYVAFFSYASNLVEGDTNSNFDVFVHDRVSGETVRVSVSSDGAQGLYRSADPSISQDGRYVAFYSESNNLVEDDYNFYPDIFLHDMLSGETTLVSVASDGTQADMYSFHPSISGNGLVVGFGSDATNLVEADTNNVTDIFVHELGEAPVGFSISGQVTDGNGDPLEGVEIDCDCGSTAMSGADGNYTITDLITGTYTITPTALNYTFAPITRTVSVPPDATGQDFVGELIAYSISGQVLDGTGDPLMGVVMATNDGLTATTGLDGNYLFPEVVAGSYTVTAVLEGYTFTPTMRIVNLPPDAIGQDFVGELLTYIIAGRVADADGNPLPGVRISASDAYSATTGQQGYYGIAGVLPGTYTLTASLEGYTFEPSWRTVSVPPSAIGQYFTGELITYAISGRVTGIDSNPLAGVSIYAGAEYSATTDISGTYTISDVIPGTYTVTAMLEGYTFTPISRTVSVPPDAVGQDFTAVMEVIFAWLPMVVK